MWWGHSVGFSDNKDAIALGETGFKARYNCRENE